jgi:hypothetical protein
MNARKHSKTAMMVGAAGWRIGSGSFSFLLFFSFVWR